MHEQDRAQGRRRVRHRVINKAHDDESAVQFNYEQRRSTDELRAKRHARALARRQAIERIPDPGRRQVAQRDRRRSSGTCGFWTHLLGAEVRGRARHRAVRQVPLTVLASAVIVSRRLRPPGSGDAILESGGRSGRRGVLTRETGVGSLRFPDRKGENYEVLPQHFEKAQVLEPPDVRPALAVAGANQNRGWLERRSMRYRNHVKGEARLEKDRGI
jgi:hypothetical protein